jgi:predicted amidophosphoribosyltransferase
LTTYEKARLEARQMVARMKHGKHSPPFFLPTCGGCGERNYRDAKTCSECGRRLYPTAQEMGR